MSTHEIAALTLIFFTGVAIGAAFFGGLWWTVLKGVRTSRPALLFLASFLLRMTSVLIAFYLVGTAHSDRLAGCLLGFVLGRVLVTRLTRPAMTKDKS
jgi:F1F0 ATPase subunit 2